MPLEAYKKIRYKMFLFSDSDENVFYYLYLIAQTTSSIYGYIWDIKMDWGFFAKNAGENRFLREEVVYSSK